MMAGLATLKKMKEEKIIEKLNQRTTDFVSEINGLIREFDLNLHLISQGSLMWFHNEKDKEPSSLTEISPEQGESYKKFFHFCLQEDLYFAPSGFEVAFMSWAHNEKIMVDTMLGLKNVFAKIKEGSSS